MIVRIQHTRLRQPCRVGPGAAGFLSQLVYISSGVLVLWCLITCAGGYCFRYQGVVVEVNVDTKPALWFRFMIWIYHWNCSLVG